ncbi:MAG TPA: PP2C family protein-serine/threonine phosphatase [Bryobacteraceae bacterium]|nr:PP2C family protein-serine/threonine phosphatase [Bryobacteraceae bacterium]
MRRLVFPLLIALAGIASLALLFPRFDPAASLHAAMSRSQAIARTRQLAAANGLHSESWKAVAADSLLTPKGPYEMHVSLIAPRRGGTFQAAWHADGNLAWTKLPGAAAPRSAGSIHIDTEAGPQNRSRVQVSTRDPGSSRDRLTYLALRILDTLWRILVLAFFVVAAFRRRLRYRVALILTAMLTVWAIVSYVGSTSLDRGRLVKASVDRMLDEGNFDIDVNVGGAGRPNEVSPPSAVFWIFIVAAAGVSVRGAENHQKWHAVDLLTRRKLFNLPVGSAVATGLLCGIGIAAIPYWVAASGVFRGSVLVFRSVEALTAPFPTAVAWDLAPAVIAIMVFGFWLPVTARWRPPVLRWGFFVPVGVVSVAYTSAAFSTPGANLFTGTLLFAAFLLLYWKTDVLAAMTAMVAANAVLTPWILLSQPGGSVKALAIPILMTWGLLLAASLRAAGRGQRGEELAVTPVLLDSVEEGNTKTGRVRLEAEFEVARKAQEDALPPAPPVIEGYTIAGSCEPAQQVGGDLYDYFSLADGRLGIAVADVSGKGVPAALYMMVTKGLLAATTRESSDLAYIFQHVNRHLYAVCKKKVFVTLTAVALDPAARRLQHARAGHNPILWRRPGRGETVVLKPPGLGMGMTAGDRFQRILKVEELELESGDAVVLYSDGITEAMNEELQLFGEQRLIRAVESVDGKTAEESRTAILRELAAFTNGTPPRDDVTLVVLRVSGNGMLI